MGCNQKNFKLVWQCHQFLSGFLAKGHLPRVSRQSRRSLMKWTRRLCTDLLALRMKKTPGKPLLGDRLMKIVRPVIASDGIPLPPDVEGMEKERKKERIGDHPSTLIVLILYLLFSGPFIPRCMTNPGPFTFGIFLRYYYSVKYFPQFFICYEIRSAEVKFAT